MFVEIKPFLDWIYLHPNWAIFATFIISFLESLAIVGLLIPGSVMMTAIGVLVGTHYLPFLSTTISAILGAILGDILSFWLGYHFHGHIRDFWPFRSLPGLFKKGALFFQQHGGKSIFLGRFVGPVRPILPLIAGMMSMNPWRFLIVDTFSGILWAPTYMLPGILLGAASQTLPPEMATRLILFVVLILFILSCISWLLKRLYFWIQNFLSSLLNKAWSQIIYYKKLNFLQKLLQDPSHPESHQQLGLALSFLVLVSIFIILCYSVITQGSLTTFNIPVYHLMRSLRTPIADYFFVAVTLLSVQIFIPMILAVLGVLLLQKHWRAAVHWAMLALISIGSIDFFKTIIHSSRPLGLLHTPAGWSFPSGHTTISLALFGFLAVLLCREYTVSKRWAVYSIAAIFSGIIMISRLYLTAHWLTDILGGIILALLCIILVTLSYQRKATQPISSLSILIIASLSLTLSWSYAFSTQYQQALQEYTPYWRILTVDTTQWWKYGSQQAPLYRTNRFGKPIENLNIQWSGDTADIEALLNQQGWYKLSKPSLISAIDSLAVQNYKHQPFFIEPLYEDKKAVLQMAKVIKIQQTSALLILRLWDAHLLLDQGQPLWLGVVSYHKPWHIHFIKRKINNNLGPWPNPISVLTQDLKNLEWKLIQIPMHENSESGSMLLIRDLQR